MRGEIQLVNVMSIVKYPPHIVEDVLKFYISGKAPAYPNFVKRRDQWVVSDFHYKTYNIYEIPEEKLYEGIKGIAKRLSAFARFEGYVWKIEILTKGSEAIDMMK
jgi:hypothetical protein